MKECRPETTVSVNFKPTVPIPYDQSLTPPDELKIKIYIPTKYKYQSKNSALDTCEIDLTTADMKYGKNITISGICNNIKNNRLVLDYHFTVVPNTRAIWYAYRLPSVRVSIYV